MLSDCNMSTSEATEGSSTGVPSSPCMDQGPSGSRGSAAAVRGRGRGGRGRGRRGTRGGRGGRGRGRGRAEVEAPETRPTARGRARGRRLPRSQAQRVAALQEQCRERLRGDINDLTETEAKGFLLLVAERQPYLVCDIMGVTSGRRDEPPRDPARAESTPDWCVCTRCRDMGQDVEKLCCNMQPENCLSVRPDMDLHILDRTTLSMVGLYRADIFALPAREDNEAMRHYAYHQFILWRHGRLGQGDRRVIPSCCLWRIRDTYPSADGQYTGFRMHRLA